MKYQSILEAVYDHSRDNVDKLCLTDDTQQVTYLQYVELVEKYATFFADRGIKKCDCVVVEGCQTIDFLAIELGLHLLGGIFVPLEHGVSWEKLKDIADRCCAKMVISEKIENSDLGLLTFSQVRESLSSCVKYKFNFPNGDDVSEILFSTGTTGKEKGIVLKHASAVAVAENIAYGVQMQDDNVELIPSPLNHSHGLRSYYANMLMGGTVIVEKNVMELNRFFGDVDKYGVNSMDLVPSALSMILLLSGDKFGEYRNELRFVEFGAAPMADKDRDKIKELLPKTPLYNFYGSTESGRVTVHNFNDSKNKKGCIGKPTCNVELVIVDDNRHIINSDVCHTGLLATRGSMNMCGYYDDEDETKKVLQDGFVYSNDVAYIDCDGDVILLGRKNDVINIGGKKVSPEEIENATKRFPGVVDCGCIAIESAVLGQEPKLFVQMGPHMQLDAVSLRAFLNGILEKFKVPQLIEQIDKIPRSYNGKLLRKELY